MGEIAGIEVIIKANLICGTCKYRRGCANRLLKGKPCKLKVEWDTKKLSNTTIGGGNEEL